MRRIVSNRGCADLHRLVAVAMGANLAGCKGVPRKTLAWALERLAASGVVCVAGSAIYVTRAQGIGSQPDFLNAVVAIETALPPAALLRLFKCLEREAGRRFNRASGGRPLDLDIIAYRGLFVGKSARRRPRGSLILPHPEAVRRPFVLMPLAEVAPHWLAPGKHRPVSAVLSRMRSAPGEVRRTLDFICDPCDDTS